MPTHNVYLIAYIAFWHAILGGLKYQVLPEILAHPVWHAERLYILPMLLFHFLEENKKVTLAEYIAFQYAILGGLKYHLCTWQH